MDNKKPINEWLCNENENYQQKFAGKHLDKRPKLGKAPVCVRFHTKGFCFNEYVNKNTHISSQDLSSSTKKDYTDFIKVCRSWSTGHTHLCEVPLNKIKVPPDLLSTLKLQQKYSTSTPFLNGNDPLEVFSLSKIPSSSLQTKVPPILSSSKEVLAMSDSTNLAEDLLGKFDIENVFCKILPFLGSDKGIFYHQTKKVRSTFYFLYNFTMCSYESCLL